MRARAPRTLLVLGAAVALGACATPPPEPAEPSVTAIPAAMQAIAEQLVAEAKLWTDVRSARVCVLGIREAPPELRRRPERTALRDTRSLEDMGARLSRELLMTLSNRFHVLETSLVAGSTATLRELPDQARSLGATHLVLGDMVQEDDHVVVDVRMVDAKSRLIVAAARGRIPLDPVDPPVAARLDPDPASPTLPLGPAPREAAAPLTASAAVEPWQAEPGGVSIAGAREPPHEVAEDFATWRARHYAERKARPGNEPGAEVPGGSLPEPSSPAPVQEELAANATPPTAPTSDQPAATPVERGPGNGWMRALGRDLSRREADGSSDEREPR